MKDPQSLYHTLNAGHVLDSSSNSTGDREVVGSGEENRCLGSRICNQVGLFKAEGLLHEKLIFQRSSSEIRKAKDMRATQETGMSLERF